MEVIKIIGIEAKTLPVSNKQPFQISYGSINQMDNVFVKVTTDTGITGYGEASAIGFISGDTNASVMGAIELLTPLLCGIEIEPKVIHSIMNKALFGNSAAKAALDIAIYDALSKVAELPLAQFLGATVNTVASDVTLAIDTLENTIAMAKMHYDRGFKTFKIKANNDYQHCKNIVHAIKTKLPQASVRIDANQAWDVEGTLDFVREMYSYNIEYIEQPVPRKRYQELKQITTASPIQIMADESAFDLEDAQNLLSNDMIDLVNIKLMKSGGIYPALQIADYCSKEGIQCGIGCMMESKLGLSAALAVALAHPNITKIDLDSIIFVDSTYAKLGLDYKDGSLTQPKHLGLGLEENLW